MIGEACFQGARRRKAGARSRVPSDVESIMALRLAQIAVAVSIVAFWLHSMREALDLAQEAPPPEIRHGSAPYEAVIARALQSESEKEQYLGIYQNGKRVGYSFTTIARADNRNHLIRTEMEFTTKLLVSIPAHARSEIQIGPDYLIEHFTTDIGVGTAMGEARMRVEGVANDKELIVTVRSSLGGPIRTARVFRELAIFNGLSPFVGVPQLQVGEEWHIQGIDFSMLGGGLDSGVVRTKNYAARIVRQETLEADGKQEEVFVAEIPEEANDPLRRRSQAWIARDGRILREEHRVLSWTFTFQREKKPPGLGWRRSR